MIETIFYRLQAAWNTLWLHIWQAVIDLVVKATR